MRSQRRAALQKGLAGLGAPPVLGFGIPRPAEVRAGIAAGAAGVISGSAVVARLGALAARKTDLDTVVSWLAAMRSAAVFGGFRSEPQV